MKINTKRFQFGKSKTGKKVHIFPRSTMYDYPLCLSLRVGSRLEFFPYSINNIEDKQACKICSKEYPTVINSPLFTIFVG